MKTALLLALAAIAIGCAGCSSCTDITEMTYHGPAVCQGQGGMLGNINGVPVWSGGTPNRRYRVLCGIQFSWTENGSRAASEEYAKAVDEIVRIVKARGAHAMINIGAESKVIGHTQTIPIKQSKQYFQLIQYLD
jgi:hypothetical protein